MPDERSLDDLIAAAEGRWTILDGLARVLADPRAFLEVVVAAPGVDAARTLLQDAYGLTEIQATAALDLQVRRVTVDERRRMAVMAREALDGLEELRGRSS